MTELAVFELADGGSVLVEVDSAEGISRVGRQGDIMRSVGRTFDEALSTVRDAATAALSQFQTMTCRPDEVAINFGDVRAAVLALLADRPMHGYEMLQELELRTQGVWWPSPAPSTRRSSFSKTKS